ncbi:MAG: DUF4160 domain-containing protein [Burkholderiaceae bacterium]
MTNQSDTQPALAQAQMPELSRFLGIVIAMFYRDHAPGHFHAYYGEYEITVEIESGRVNGASRGERSVTYRSGGCCTIRSYLLTGT